MTNEQAKNVLDWVEAMLSGRYKHGKEFLYNPLTNCFCANGVAAHLGAIDHDAFSGHFYFGSEYQGLSSRRRVPDSWFAQRFGLRYDQNMYWVMNDKADSYLPVCAILLNQVPLGMRQKRLQLKFEEQVNVINKGR